MKNRFGASSKKIITLLPSASKKKLVPHPKKTHTHFAPIYIQKIPQNTSWQGCYDKWWGGPIHIFSGCLAKNSTSQVTNTYRSCSVSVLVLSNVPKSTSQNQFCQTLNGAGQFMSFHVGKCNISSLSLWLCSLNDQWLRDDNISG